MSAMDRISHKGRAPVSIRERIEASIEVSPEGCWVWQKSKNSRGYGQMWVGSRADGTRRTEKAHRAAYTAFIGKIPEGLHLDHLCRNPSCVNPAHLEPVTPQVNVLRGETQVARNVAKTHCPHGHEYTEANTYMNKRKRYCRTCGTVSSREWARRDATKTDALEVPVVAL